MKRTISLLPVFLALAAPVAAHDMEKGPHGGQIVDVKGHHVEFTAKDAAITVYLTDDKDGAIASAGAEAKAVVQNAGKAETVTLAAAAPNLLIGTLGAALTPGAKIIIAGKLADGHEILARFVAK